MSKGVKNTMWTWKKSAILGDLQRLKQQAQSLHGSALCPLHKCYRYWHSFILDFWEWEWSCLWFYACSWDIFPHVELNYPVLIWWFVPGYNVDCCGVFDTTLLSSLIFAGDSWKAESRKGWMGGLRGVK